MDDKENTSGQGKEASIPSEVRGWNWGAFLLNWIWGIGNSTYIALLMFVPLVNIVMPFVLGAKGSEWAWSNRRWSSVEAFKATQRKWAWAGLIVIVVLVPCCVGIPLTAMKHSDAYRMSLEAVKANNEVTAALGQPLEPGIFVSGSINSSGPDGKAALQYSVTGPNGTGDVSAYVLKHAGQWQLQEVVVQVPGKRIIVSNND